MIVSGKYAILFALVNGSLNHMQLYMSDLEQVGEIKGKIPLTPVFTGLNNRFTVNENNFKKSIKPRFVAQLI